MIDIRPTDLARRQLLWRAGALGAAAMLPPAGLPVARAASAGDNSIQLVVASAVAPLLGPGHPQTAVWAYDGRIPGPELRFRQGDRLQAIVRNGLAESTTVHWHGLRVPNDMDGVPGLTQQPIVRGGRFTYAFDLQDAGTYWYHSHDGGAPQLGRGLAGAFIVEEREPIRVDRDMVWMLSDWRLGPDAQIVDGFFRPMEAAMDGRVGNTVTINGHLPGPFKVRAGERIRLRLINAAIARMVALRFEGHRPLIIALNGQPCEPHEPAGGRIVLGPAMRADLIIDMSGSAGQRHAVIDDFYQGLAYTLLAFAYDEGPPLRQNAPDSPILLPANPIPDPDLANAEAHEMVLQGGMMGGQGMTMGSGTDKIWSIGGMSGIDGPMVPAFTLARGRTCRMTIRNETAWWHPMHLHGFAFRILARNGAPSGVAELGDTVLVSPRETVEVAFVADTPGNWMFHCHVMAHQESGLMTVIRVA